MKRILLSSLFLLTCLVMYSQAHQVRQAAEAIFAWENTSHDFGQISQGNPVTAVFQFENTGDVPLVITEAIGSCGCTVPDYTRTPILPGESGEVRAVFNAAKLGVFNKTVTIKSNASDQAVLSIQGEVVAP